jgi:L-alanine-DL-glutamate epimerase-like enolase superfamily enzyme
MKIIDVTLTLFAWDDIPATSYNAFTGQFGGDVQLGLLAIETDEGITGHSFLGSSMYTATIDAPGLIEKVKPLIMGEDPLERERLYQRISRARRWVNLRSIGAVDIALWDIAGKAAGLPIHALMGTYRTSVPAYASSAILPSIEAYCEEAAAYQDAGWTAYKIHPPGRWREDLDICAAVRKTVGDDTVLMLDAAWNYDFSQAIKVAHAIEELGYHWYEDPLADDDIYGCARLREKISIPLVATEWSPGSFGSFAEWILLKATDALRGDVAVKGGITPLVKAAHLAEGFGMNLEVHHGGNSINNAANLHLIMGIRNCEYFEVLMPAGAHKYGLIEDIEIDGDGLAHAPMGPGLGVDIDFDLIEKKKVAVVS